MIFPSVSFAAWWNPFSWFARAPVRPQIVSTSTKTSAATSPVSTSTKQAPLLTMPTNKVKNADAVALPTSIKKPNCNVSVSPTTIIQGNTAVLSWSTAGVQSNSVAISSLEVATRKSAGGLSGDHKMIGASVVAPLVSTEYSINAYVGAGKGLSCSTVLTVLPNVSVNNPPQQIPTPVASQPVTQNSSLHPSTDIQNALQKSLEKYISDKNAILAKMDAELKPVQEEYDRIDAQNKIKCWTPPIPIIGQAAEECMSASLQLLTLTNKKSQITSYYYGLLGVWTTPSPSYVAPQIKPLPEKQYWQINSGPNGQGTIRSIGGGHELQYNCDPLGQCMVSGY